MNERITENITKKLIPKSYISEEILLYEQISSNNKIKRILGKKKPDFIIDFKNNPNNIVVIIECKADTKKQVDAKKQAEEYAKLLKSDFNVFYCGISGQNASRYLMEGHLWIKNRREPFPDKYNKLLKYQDIVKQIYTLDTGKNNVLRYRNTRFQDNSLKISKIFNEKLHKLAIPASERPVLIGCFLIALLGEFDICDNNENLKNNILTAVTNKLKTFNYEKRETIKNYYATLLSNDVWISQTSVDSFGKEHKNTNLKYFLDELKKKIMPYVHSHQWDVMGVFYREFIKYATEDKQTGLVLTPPHITDFFCELVDIRSSDVVLDPCCGTGGFLIAAMKYMCDKANSDAQKKEIKTNQLFGIEKRHDMWLHASVNMMMHGDGHTNIFHGNCFQFTIDKFKNKKPTVAFLNPPYNESSEQLRFIQKALELVIPRGKVIAIVQSSATGNSVSVNNAKREILNHHTLLASFSCPKELFHGIAGVITNILIFEAHVPHNPKNATFLGWFKDDGFVKQKKKRIEQNWQKIKEKWIDAYNHKKEIKEFNMESKMQILTASDEWCIEAYLKPDLPSPKDFMLTIKDYILHEFEVLLDDKINRDL